MAVGRIRADTAVQLRAALADPSVVARYRSKIPTVDGSPCWCWVGAISSKGHGRFWLRSDVLDRDFAVIAHRFGFALAHGPDALLRAGLLAHGCDNPLCQRIDDGHVHPSTGVENRRAWASRRHRVSEGRFVTPAERLRGRSRFGTPSSPADRSTRSRRQD